MSALAIILMFEQERVVGQMEVDFDFLPPLGSIVQIDEFTFSVSDVITKLRYRVQEGDYIVPKDGPHVTVECSKSFATLQDFEQALFRLAMNDVAFDPDVLDYIEQIAENLK